MAKAPQKTNAVRMLDAAHVPYQSTSFKADRAFSGIEVAQMLGVDVSFVFKTLVAQGRSGTHYVFMIPVAEELDLKKAAHVVSEKSVAMIKAKELLPLTGYVHGGCSPIGMKKQFATYIDETAILHDFIMFSGGRIGLQLTVDLEDLKGALDYTLADLVV